MHYELHIGDHVYKSKRYEILKQTIAQYDIEYKIFAVYSSVLNCKTNLTQAQYAEIFKLLKKHREQKLKNKTHEILRRTYRSNPLILSKKRRRAEV